MKTMTCKELGGSCGENNHALDSEIVFSRRTDRSPV
jgi:hypothetical protein